MDLSVSLLRKLKWSIIFHTTYTAKTLETMKASFNINISKFRKNKSVWFDASYKDVSGSVTMTKSETDKLNGYIEEVESLAKKNKSYLDKNGRKL